MLCPEAWASGGAGDLTLDASLPHDWPPTLNSSTPSKFFPTGGSALETSNCMILK